MEDDRRTAQRFFMNLPLEIKIATEADPDASGLAVESQDVSYRGLYFVIDREIELGSPIEFVLTLPKELTLAGDVRIRCLGRVARVETPQAPGSVGVAAVIDRYEFLPPASSSPAE